MDLFGLSIVLDFQDRMSSGMMNANRVFNTTRTNAQQTVRAIDQNAVAYERLGMTGMQTSIAGYGMIKAGTSVLGWLGQSVNEASSFEKELKILQNTAGMTDAQFKKWGASNFAIKTGIETAFSPQEAVQGMYELKSAGLSNKAVFDSLRSTLNLVAASAGEIDLSSGSALMASTLTKFNLASSQAPRIANLMAKLANVSNFHYGELPAFINSLGSAPSKLGRPIEELMAMGGLLRNVGQESAQSGQTVAGFAGSITLMTSALKREGKGRGGSLATMKLDAMKALGLDSKTLYDAKGNARSMMEIFRTLLEHTSKMTQQQRVYNLQKVFGDQAGNLANAIELSTKQFMVWDKKTQTYVQQVTKDKSGRTMIFNDTLSRYTVATTKQLQELKDSGKTSFDEMVSGLKNVDGEASKAAKGMLNTTWGTQKLLQGSVQTFQILLGQTVLPVLNKGIQGITKLMNHLISFGKAHPTIMKVFGYGVGLAGLLLVIGGVLTVTVGSFLLFTSVMGKASMGLTRFAISQGWVNGSMVTSRAVVEAYTTRMRGLAVSFLKLALLAGALKLAWKYDFLGVRTTVTGFIDHVKDSFTRADQIMGMSTDNMIASVHKLDKGGFFDNLTAGIVRVREFWKGLCDAWNDDTLSDDNFKRMKELGLLPLLELILDVKHNAELFFTGFKEGFKAVGDITSSVVKGILEKVGELLDGFSHLTGNTGLGDTASAIKDIAKANRSINPKVWKDIGRVAGFAAGLWTISKVFGFVAKIGGWLAPVVSFLTTIGGWVLRIGKLLIPLISSLSLPVLIIAGIITIIGILYLKFKPVRDIVNHIIDLIKINVVAAFNIMMLQVCGVLAEIRLAFEILKGAIEAIIVTLVGIVKTTFEGFKLLVRTQLQLIIGVFKSVFVVIRDIVTGRFGDIGKDLKNIWGGVFKNIGGFAKEAFNNVAKIWKGVINTFKDIADSIKDTFVGLFKWLAGKFKWVTQTVKDVKKAAGWVGDKVGAVKNTIGKGFNAVGNFLGLSTGGYVKSTGLAVLHPNEVVVNDNLTQKLDSFLGSNKQDPKEAFKVALPVLASSSPASNTKETQTIHQEDYSVNFGENSIQITLQKTTKEEAESFVNFLWKEIKKKNDLENKRNYKKFK
jgi:TP901 family phage tail tape measure protein